MDNELRRVIDALPGLVWTALPAGQIDFLNRRWFDYTGLTPAQVSGEGWLAAVHPEDLNDLQQNWRTIVASGKTGESEVRLRRFDGVYRWFHFTASPLADSAGKWCCMSHDIDERKRSNAKLTAALAKLGSAEGRLRTIIDTVPSIAWCSVPDGSGQFYNQRWHDYTGVSADSGGDWLEAIHPDNRAEVAQRWRAFISSGHSDEVEGRLRRFDGAHQWFLFRFWPLRDETGQIVTLYGATTDIEDRKRVEALLDGEMRLLEMVALGQSLEAVLNRLCRLVEEMTTGCYCGILFFSPSGMTWQLGAAPALPSGYNETMHGRPAHRYSGPCGLAASLRTPVIVADVAADTRWDTHGWRTLALAHGLRCCWSSPILSQDEHALGALAIYKHEAGSPTPFQNELLAQLSRIASIAVERTRSEGALRRSEAFLAKAQKLSSTGSFSWRVTNNDFTWSEQAYRIFGLNSTEAVTLELLRSRVHAEDVVWLDDMLTRARDGLDFEYEYRLRMPDQSVKHVHLVAQAIKEQDGQVEYIGAVQDVTQQRLSEEALGKVRAELAHVTRVTTVGVLTASIAHEVNQPLSGIITNASTCLRMLGAEPPNVEGAKETARRTIRDGNRASDVILRLRSLFGKKAAAAECVDLNEATREVIALTLSELQRRKVILRSELADDLPAVTGDRVQLQQVILNLLLNASEAMTDIEDRPRQVRITTTSDESNGVRVSVQDAGTGFPPQDAERLFEAFYTTKTTGMGMGLSVSRSIIESHHGRLWAAVNDGPGATLSFSIPGAVSEQTSRNP